jgi:hypothetical protein
MIAAVSALVMLVASSRLDAVQHDLFHEVCLVPEATMTRTIWVCECTLHDKEGRYDGSSSETVCALAKVDAQAKANRQCESKNGYRAKGNWNACTCKANACTDTMASCD